MKVVPRLLREDRGATATEFALVLPLLLILLFGIIDAGRFLWEFNRAEKATQAGVRYAAVTDLLPGSDFAAYSFAVEDGVPAGNTVTSADFDHVTCNEDGCADCVGAGSSICDTVDFDPTTFANLISRMAAMCPSITAANVEVVYRNVGLGYAGDPNGPDVSPQITVRFRDDKPLTFQPITLLLFGGALTMPNFSASLTAEDLAGSESN